MAAPLSRVFLLVLDSVGCGALSDAAEYGDEGSDTLGNVSRAVGGLDLPSLQAAGLGNLHPIQGVPPVDEPTGAYGKMSERSPGKDTTTGHWELAGLVSVEPFRLFPDGFPAEILDPICEVAERGILGNCSASGTEVIERLGAQHMETGDLIVYTSADSVFQVAAHEEVVPLEELYRICRIARDVLDPYRVARVIARPFVGKPGAFKRTYNRRDFSMPPPRATVLDRLREASVVVTGVGKIEDIFAGRGLSRSIHTEGNAQGLEVLADLVGGHGPGLVFVNLVDFDMLYGHRNDPVGYAAALKEVDDALPEIVGGLREDDLLIITADHGCDPTTASTDHSREYVPLLLLGPGVQQGVNVGVRETFADVGQTVAEALGASPTESGTSILPLAYRSPA